MTSTHTYLVQNSFISKNRFFSERGGGTGARNIRVSFVEQERGGNKHDLMLCKKQFYMRFSAVTAWVLSFVRNKGRRITCLCCWERMLSSIPWTDSEKKLYIYISTFFLVRRINPFTTRNPFLGTKLLGFSMGRGSGALKGLTCDFCFWFFCRAHKTCYDSVEMSQSFSEVLSS